MRSESGGIAGRISLLREAEGLSQEEFSRLIGINTGTLRNIEQGRTKAVRSDVLDKIAATARFRKFLYWLISGDVIPRAGQVSPYSVESIVARSENAGAKGRYAQKK